MGCGLLYGEQVSDKITMWELAGVIVVVVMLAGIVLGWVAYFRVKSLERQLDELKQHLGNSSTATAGITASSNPQEHGRSISETHRRSSEGESAEPASAPDIFPELPDLDDLSPTAHPEQSGDRLLLSAETSPGLLSQWRNQWMIWLGGLCVALAGIFMVRYSIEQGLLSPGARIGLALATGIAFHIGAEWLRRRRGSHQTFAALAGGASITLYAALLASLHLYQLLNANLVFLLLALVSLATMALALRQGPILAAMGILGGYAVPILVSTGSNNVVAAMVYAVIIFASGLLLLRYVFRAWLFWGLIAGVAGWWLASMTSSQADNVQGLYLTLACYLLLAIPDFDWLLGKKPLEKEEPLANKEPSEKIATGAGKNRIQTALVVLILAWGVSISHQGASTLQSWQATVHWGTLILIIGLGVGRESMFRDQGLKNQGAKPLPWISLLTLIAAVVISRLEGSFGNGIVLISLGDEHAAGFQGFILQIALLYAFISFVALKTRGFCHFRASLALLSPLLLLALVYVLTGDLSGSWQWSLATISFGVGYLGVASFKLQKSSDSAWPLWLILGGHMAYSLAVAMYFREAGLTLALAAQLITLAWLIRKYSLPWLPWLVKAVLAIVVARLSLNPWLASYSADIHWSLWIYGGSTLCCFIASRVIAGNNRLQPWLAAATAHLLVLTLGAEVRYWLYDGDIFTAHYSLKESAINSCLWAAMGLSYHYRSGFSANLKPIYSWAAAILLTLALLSYGLAATVLNPLWHVATISPRPLFNLLLLAYGLPIILALLVHRYYLVAVRQLAGIVAAAGLLLFVSLEIRHLWQGELSLFAITSNGELYTYSIVWLLMAVAAVVIGTIWRRSGISKGGFLLLAMVIAKIFVVDMADLEGLLRVASFMGLGLSLLGLAYLRSKLTAIPALNPTQKNPTQETIAK
ncbi:MAG: DUF2339 domain-containing protein [Porticoccaceae bacterium]|nr:DUF2339 domain-containing protein [Porticoccaceae bacterium]